MAKNVEVHLNLTDQVVTAGAGAILTSFIKFLAVQRHQIPFSYHTFRHLVNRVQKDGQQTPSWKEYQLERQREVAHGTIMDYEKLFNAIRLAFGSQVQEAVLLFGATMYSAKEAWRIQFPEDMKTHSPEISTGRLQRMADHTVMTINAQEILSDNLARHFQPTNMYLMVKVAGKLPKYPYIKEVFTERDDCFISRSCVVSRIVLEDSHEDNAMDVCQEERRGFSWGSWADLFRGFKKPEEAKEPTESQWYECAVSVKGYKDVQVKGKTIWNM